MPNKVLSSDPYLRGWFSSWLYLWTTSLALFWILSTLFLNNHLISMSDLVLSHNIKCHILLLSNLWSSSCIAMIQYFQLDFLVNHFQEQSEVLFLRLFWSRFWWLFLGCWAYSVPNRTLAGVPSIWFRHCPSSMKTVSGPVSGTCSWSCSGTCFCSCSWAVFAPVLQDSETCFWEYYSCSVSNRVQQLFPLFVCHLAILP